MRVSEDQEYALVPKISAGDYLNNMQVSMMVATCAIVSAICERVVAAWIVAYYKSLVSVYVVCALRTAGCGDCTSRPPFAKNESGGSPKGGKAPAAVPLQRERGRTAVSVRVGEEGSTRVLSENSADRHAATG